MNLVEIESGKYRVEGYFLNGTFRLFQVNLAPNHAEHLFPPGEVLVVVDLVRTSRLGDRMIYIVGKTNARGFLKRGDFIPNNVSPRRPCNWDDYQKLIGVLTPLARKENSPESFRPLQELPHSRAHSRCVFLSYASGWARKFLQTFKRKVARR